jgi:putative oxidoreductase
MLTDAANTVSRFFYQRNVGLLILRVSTGLIFLMHGWMKIHNLPQTGMMFAHMGFGSPVGYFIAWLEVIGGLALILGIATRFFGVVFFIEMLVATLVVGFGRGLGLEFYLAAVSLAIALMGSGAFSVFKMECDNCGGFLCDGSTGVCVVTE